VRCINGIWIYDSYHSLDTLNLIDGGMSGVNPDSLNTDKSPGIGELHVYPKLLHEVREDIEELSPFSTDLHQINVDWRCTTGKER